MKSTLNFSKFVNVASKHSVYLDKIFSIGKEVVFLQAKYNSHSFFIYIPDKYQMFIKNDVSRINIDTNDNINNITINFVNTIKDKVSTSFLVVSNNYIFTTEDTSYKISGKIRIHNAGTGLLNLIEKQSRDITRDISIKFKDTAEPQEKISWSEPRDDPRDGIQSTHRDVSQEDEPPRASRIFANRRRVEDVIEGVGIVEDVVEEEKEDNELVFQDYNGDVINKNSNYEYLIDEEEEGSCDINNEEEEEEYENWELKDYPLQIGKLFKTISITDFFEDEGINKIISSIEIFYNDIYQIEKDTRKEKFDKVCGIYIKLKQNYDDAYNFFKNKENKLVSDKKRLQTVVSSLSFKQKLNSRSRDNILELIEKANIEIINIDIRLLKIRDEYNEYFDNYYNYYTEEIKKFKMPGDL